MQFYKNQAEDRFFSIVLLFGLMGCGADGTSHNVGDTGIAPNGGASGGNVANGGTLGHGGAFPPSGGAPIGGTMIRGGSPVSGGMGGAIGGTRTGGTAARGGAGGAFQTGGSINGGAQGGETSNNGGSAGTTAGGIGGFKVTNPSAYVKMSKGMQTIDGFGVSTAWLSAPDGEAKNKAYDALFSISKGAGLSILRNRIPFRERPGMDDKFINKNGDGTYQTKTNADGSKTFSLNWSGWDLSYTSALIGEFRAKGSDYQVTKFFSTPWTPPNNSVSKWKIADKFGSVNYGSTPEIGGTLDPAFYSDYADLLADYVLGFKAKMGVDLSVLSLQNEPNFQCEYESANWTADQFQKFFVVLKDEFTKKGVFSKLPNLKIMAPEFQNVKDDLIQPILSDASISSILGIVGVHQYEYGKSTPQSYSVPVLSASLNARKPVWMTEWSSAEWSNDTGMNDGMILAKLIHMDLTVGRMSAFLYWWAWSSGNSALVVVNGSSATIPKRLYVLGQWSRFVRPDWVRVETTLNPTNNVLLSAFRNPTGTQIAVVAVNTGSAQASFPLSIDAGQFGTLNVYRTSASENLAAVGTVPGGASPTVNVSGSSVTTFVGPWTP